MNVPRTAFTGAARAFQLFFVFVGLFAFASQSGLQAASGDTGEALALRAALRMAASQSTASALNASSDSQHTPAGKALLSRHLMRSGAISRSFSAGSSTVPIPGSVQTFDLFNPPPAFQPLIGYGTPTALSNNPASPPVYLNNLTPLNLTPVWSQDETFIIFSSDRTLQGGIQADHRFHLWAISVNGGEAYQITTSSGGNSGGEFFPAMVSADNRIAFTSDAQTPGDALNPARQNLYVIPFSYSVLTASNNARASLINVNDVTSILPYTNRGNDSVGNPLTGFDQVQRPTFSPSNNDLVVFSAHSASTLDANSGHYHIYYLYLSTGGFDPNNTSEPAKLTNGPADDTDPAFSKDGQFIAIASTATQLTNQGSPSSSDPNTAQSTTSLPNVSGLRNLFLIGGGGGTGVSSPGLGTIPPSLASTGGKITTAANTDNYGPAWSSVAYNQYTNTNPGFEYLAFARATAPSTTHDIYYLQTVSGLNSTGGGQTISPENSLVTNTGGAIVPNAVVKLNTDDNGAPNSVPANSYDDVYPTWSPFRSIFSIAYESGSVRGADSLSGTLANGTVFGGRTVTYNDPATGFPSETAFSVGAGGTVASTMATGSYTVAPSYIGILQSEVLNLNPPNLLRYSAGEIIHVQAGTLSGGVAVSPDPSPIGGTPTKTGINPGQAVTFTVRLSDRESGINNGNAGLNVGPTDSSKPQVFLQIKNPNSKYQDAQGFEHKVFARDAFYSGQANHPANDNTSNTANLLSIDGPLVDGLRDVYPTYGLDLGNAVFPRGAHGGFYQQNGNNPKPTTIFVGKKADGTTNPDTRVDTTRYPTDPGQFTAWGPEYECQFLNPQFAGPDPVASEYATPYWLAGVDDQLPFSGEGQQRPTANGGESGAGAEWLQLSKSLIQDNLGGVLYTVSWKTPISGSDFYLDAIAFDQAGFPNFAGAPDAYAGKKVNWRIYDNVGGFSTNTSIGSNDILVVSDNTLGQKFATTTFGGTNGNLNLVPKLYGAESQITDVDVDILPDAVYAGYPINPATGPTKTVFVPAISAMSEPYLPLLGTGAWLNGLGVGSYNDTAIDDGGRVGGSSFVASQKYSIWRILSRGPLPQSILNSYLPTKQTQPAVVDKQAASAAYTNVPAADVLDAHRCVLWISPYTGDLLADPGTIDDPGAFNRPGAPDRQSTQTILRGFVQGGGRLFVTGQDVGSTLTTGGFVANGAGGFLSDVLGASLATSGGGTFQLAATANRITNYPTFDGTNDAQNGRGIYPVVVGNVPSQYIQTPGGEPFRSRLEISGAQINDPNFASDASLSQRASFSPTGFTGANLLGQPDTLKETKTSSVAMTYNGGAAAMVIHDDPYNSKGSGKLPDGGTGGRTVYAGFGLEALSNDAYSSDGSNPSTTTPPIPPPITTIPVVLPRNPRANILHNIVGYLRTGSVSGVITQTAGTGAGAGQGVPGVTVYLVSSTGIAPPTRVTFSATTSSDGRYSILGVEPGTYTLAAYKPGYAHAASNAGISFLVEGDASANASLTITPQPSGSIAGNVHDTANKPVVGATVSFLSKDKTIVKATTTFDGTNPLQPAGNYFLSNVPVTDYTGSATGPTNPDQGNPEYLAAAAPDAPYTTDVNVQPNTTTGDGSAQGGVPVTFTLTSIPATISGRVYDITAGDNDAGGAVVSGATLVLLDSAGKPVLDATNTAIVGKAGADGKYTLVGIPAAGQTPTTYTISVNQVGYNSNSFTQVVYLGGIYTTLTTSGHTDLGLGLITNGGTLGGLVTGTTTATPITGVTISITDTGTGQIVSATSGATTTAPDGSGSINYGPITLSAGTYNVTAAKNGKAAGAQSVTIAANVFSRVDFTGLPALHTFPPGLNFLSAPYDYSGSSFDALFGALNTAPAGTTPNGNRSHVAVWDPTVSAYAVDPTPPADAFRLGRGYWVFLKNGADLLQAGVSPTGPTVSVALRPFWNQIGVPGTSGVPVSSLRFNTGATTLSFANAISSSNHVVSPTLYRYDGNAYQTVGAVDTLQPYQAYWIKVFVATSVLIPTGK